MGVLLVLRTPLEWAKWARYLEAHPDQDYAAYIVQGLQEGFRIVSAIQMQEGEL